MSGDPDPMTPAGCDLRGMPYMPLDLARLFDSDTYALSSGDEFKAALTLWGKAFLQVPAGSLPNDDRLLASLSGAGARWRRVKAVALRGFVVCADGRLYHPTVAEKAREAWEARLAQRARTAAARAARGERRRPPDTGPAASSVTDPVADPVAGSKGEGEGKGIKNSPLTPTTGVVGGPKRSKAGRKNSRAAGTSPRAVAGAERAAEAAARPPGPGRDLWPALQALGMAAGEFRAWIEPLEVRRLNGVAELVAPTRFHRDWVAQHHRIALANALGRPVEVVVAEAAA